MEQLEAQICELAGHLTAATCRFLLLVGDFDARRGWADWDLPSCAAWLAWKCQIAPGTAREQVRVARALRDLPMIRAQFAAAQLSYAKVRALTRIATPATEADLAEVAGPMTAGQLERFVRAHRQVSRADDQHAATARRVSWRVEDDGSLAMSVRLQAAEGAVVLQALRAAAGDLDHPHPTIDHPSGVPAETPERVQDGQDLDPGAAGLADALVEVAGAFLADKITTAGNPDLYQVIVHVGPEALTTEAGWRSRGNALRPATRQGPPGPGIPPTPRAATSKTDPPSAPPPRSGSPARPPSAGCCTTTMETCWTWGADTALRRPRCVARSANATGIGANSPAATPAALTSTTSSPGPEAARPGCAT